MNQQFILNQKDNQQDDFLSFKLIGKKALLEAFGHPKHGTKQYWLVHQGYRHFQRIQNKELYPNVQACMQREKYNDQFLRKELRILGNKYRNGQTHQRKQKNSSEASFKCYCGKSFWHISSLSRHKKQCVKPLKQGIQKFFDLSQKSKSPVYSTNKTKHKTSCEEFKMEHVCDCWCRECFESNKQ